MQETACGAKIAHLPFGIYRPLLLKDLQKAGIKFKLFLADWHAWINNKMGGDLEVIRKVGNYFLEVWKASGVDADKVEIVWASDIMDSEYWRKVFMISQKSTLSRATRALSIMGRKDTELNKIAQLFYPMMQVADIFHMKIDICQLGMDQRRANIMARELAEEFGWKKPVAVHHHMLLGLQGVIEPDKKSDFSESKKWLNDLDIKIQFFASLLSRLNPEKHFASNFKNNLDNLDFESKIHDVGQVWPRKMLEIRHLFENRPEVLNSFIKSNIPLVINRIITLEHILKALKNINNEKILQGEWSEWVKNYDYLNNLICSDLSNRAHREKTSPKEETYMDSKMSKSKTASAIFVHDSRQEILDKMKSAFCRPKEVQNNPVLEYCREIIFRSFKEFKVERPSKFGGDLFFHNYESLEDAFRSGSLHPQDLKNATAEHLDQLIRPIREHFERNKKARDLLSFVRSQEITR